MKNKRAIGILKKVLITLGIIALIFIIMGSITSYQLYSLYKTIDKEKANIEDSAKELRNGNCSKMQSINESINKMRSKAESACKNPLIKKTLEKNENRIVKCDNLGDFKDQIQNLLDLGKRICDRILGSDSLK